MELPSAYSPRARSRATMTPSVNHDNIDEILGASKVSPEGMERTLKDLVLEFSSQCQVSMPNKKKTKMYDGRCVSGPPGRLRGAAEALSM